MREVLQQVEGDDADALSHILQGPVVQTEKLEARPAKTGLGVEFAGDQLDEGGFARTVRSEQGDVLAAPDLKCEASEHTPVATGDGQVLEIDQERSGGGHWITVGRSR